MVARRLGVVAPSLAGHESRSIAPPGVAAKFERTSRLLCQKLIVLPRTEAGSVIEKLPFASGQRFATGLITPPGPETPTTRPR